MDKVTESNLKDPELRQWHLPATGIAFHQLEGEGQGLSKKNSMKKGNNSLTAKFKMLGAL